MEEETELSIYEKFIKSQFVVTEKGLIIDEYLSKHSSSIRNPLNLYPKKISETESSNWKIALKKLSPGSRIIVQDLDFGFVPEFFLKAGHSVISMSEIIIPEISSQLKINYGSNFESVFQSKKEPLMPLVADMIILNEEYQFFPLENNCHPNTIIYLSFNGNSRYQLFETLINLTDLQVLHLENDGSKVTLIFRFVKGQQKNQGLKELFEKLTSDEFPLEYPIFLEAYVNDSDSLSDFLNTTEIIFPSWSNYSNRNQFLSKLKESKISIIKKGPGNQKSDSNDFISGNDSFILQNSNNYLFLDSIDSELEPEWKDRKIDYKEKIKNLTAEKMAKLFYSSLFLPVKLDSLTLSFLFQKYPGESLIAEKESEKLIAKYLNLETENGKTSFLITNEQELMKLKNECLTLEIGGYLFFFGSENKVANLFIEDVLRFSFIETIIIGSEGWENSIPLFIWKKTSVKERTTRNIYNKDKFKQRHLLNFNKGLIFWGYFVKLAEVLLDSDTAYQFDKLNKKKLVDQIKADKDMNYISETYDIEDSKKFLELVLFLRTVKDKKKEIDQIYLSASNIVKEIK